jgi:drug/metabolite transporter superfamily protein YnfA
LRLNSGVRYCKGCGAAVRGGSPWQGFSGPSGDYGDCDARDVEQNKGVSALAYIPFLFFLPLVACPDSRFGRYHANQGLIFLIVSMIWSALFAAISAVLAFLWFIGPAIIALLSLSWILFAAWFIIGIVNALGGRARPLPFIGGIRILN